MSLSLLALASPPSAGASPMPVLTTALGTNSEWTTDIPIAGAEETPEETVVYTLTVPSIDENEVLRATGSLELSNEHTYDVTTSVRLVLGKSPHNWSGIILSPWTTVTQVAEKSQISLPVAGAYQAASDLGTRYLKIVVKSSSSEASEADTLSVDKDSGRLATTRYKPTSGPTSLPTHELQTTIGGASQQISSLPVDSTWRSILSTKAEGISEGDLLDLSAQLGLLNTGATSLTVESRLILAATATATTGQGASPFMINRVTPSAAHSRIMHSNERAVTNVAKPYVNLIVRAIPDPETSPEPLTVIEGSGVIDVLQFNEATSAPSDPLRSGTREAERSEGTPDVSSIPIAPETEPEPRVVGSLPIWGSSTDGGLDKGEVVRLRGLVTTDLEESETSAIDAEFILGDSATDTTGEAISKTSRNTLMSSERVGTTVIEETYVSPEATDTKFFNLVVRAIREPAYAGESVGVPNASVTYSRSMSTGPIKLSFESGSLDQLLRYPFDGFLDTRSTQARDGAQAMHVEIDSSVGEPEGIRRVEARYPNLRAGGGHIGEDNWYGFSVYFPEGFNVPRSDDPEASKSTWNIFTQWQAPDDEINEEGCEPSLSPPISYGVRHYKAGAHTNPGASETATPVDGDYINIGFYGGEIAEDCSAPIKSKEFYVVAPLERGRWYDFVQHTRWTTEEGAPGDSVSEVWMDGKQILGDQTTPINMPSLFWYETEALNTPNAHPQFGIYHGPSEEDPPSELFIDAVRSGDSYAEVASDHEPRLEADEYPATLSATSTGSSFTVAPGTFKCEEATVQSQMANPSKQLELSVGYSECSANDTYPSLVQMNSCTYTLEVDNTSKPYSGEVGVVCIEEGDAIEFVAYLDGEYETPVCTAKIPAQEGVGGSSLASTVENDHSGLSIEGAAEGLEYELSGLCGGGLQSDGVLTNGGVTLTAENEAADATSAYLAGDGLAPRFEADTYGATVDGNGLGDFTTAGGTFSCSSSSLAGNLPNPRSKLTLAAEYDECTGGEAGELSSIVEMNSCRYTLTLRNSDPPYGGKLGIECAEEEDGIDFKALDGEAVSCKATIGPQDGVEIVGLSNLGEGVERRVAADVEVEGIEYELSGPQCAEEPETRSDGLLAGETVLAARAVGDSVGFYVAGVELPLGIYLRGEESEEEAVQPRVEADRYPISIVGTGQSTLGTSVGDFECEGSQLQTELIEPSNELIFPASHGECSALGLSVAVAENSCSYVLNVDNAGPPYSGSVDIACDEGDAIEYEVKTPTGVVLFAAKVGSQENVAQASLSNTQKGAEAGIAVDVEGENLEYELSGAYCESEIRTDGSLVLAETLVGSA